MKIGKAGYFWIWIFPLSPNLIWCRYSVLIYSLLTCWLLNITYQMIELEIVINIRVVSLYVCFLEHLNLSDLRFGSESYDSNTKMYPTESESNLLHLIRWSLSIHLSSVFDIILGWSLANQNGFIEIRILPIFIWCYLSDLLWSSAEHLPQSLICSK